MPFNLPIKKNVTFNVDPQDKINKKINLNEYRKRKLLDFLTTLNMPNKSDLDLNRFKVLLGPDTFRKKYLDYSKDKIKAEIIKANIESKILTNVKKVIGYLDDIAKFELIFKKWTSKVEKSTEKTSFFDKIKLRVNQFNTDHIKNKEYCSKNDAWELYREWIDMNKKMIKALNAQAIFKEIDIESYNNDFVLDEEIKKNLRRQVEKEIKNTSDHFSWTKTIDNSLGNKRIIDQLNIYTDKYKNDLINNLLNTKNLGELRAKLIIIIEDINKKHSVFFEQSNKMISSDNDKGLETYRINAIKWLNDNPKVYEEYCSAPEQFIHEIINENNKSKVCIFEDDSIEEFEKQIELIKDSKIKKAIKEIFKEYYLPLNIKKAIKLKHVGLNLIEGQGKTFFEIKASIGEPLSWQDLFEGLHDIKCISEAQMELRNILEKFIKESIYSESSYFFRPNPEQMIELRVLVQYLMIILQMATNEQKDSDLLFSLNKEKNTKETKPAIGVYKVLELIDQKSVLKTYLTEYINKIENGKLLYLQSVFTDTPTFNEMLEVKEVQFIKSGFTGLSTDECYQLFNKYTDKYETARIFGKDIKFAIDNLYVACRYLVIAASGNHNSAKRKMFSYKGKILNHEINNYIEKEFMIRLIQIPSNESIFKDARMNLYIKRYFNQRFYILPLTRAENIYYALRSDIESQQMKRIDANQAEELKREAIGKTIEELLFDHELTLANNTQTKTNSDSTLRSSIAQPFHISFKIDPQNFNQFYQDVVEEIPNKQKYIESLLTHTIHHLYNHVIKISCPKKQHDKICIEIDVKDLLNAKIANKPICYLNEDGLECVRLYFKGNSLHFQAYGDNFKFKIIGDLESDAIIIDNPNGDVKLVSDFQSKKYFYIGGRLNNLNYKGSISSKSSVNFDIDGKLNLNKGNNVSASNELTIRAQELNLEGRLDAANIQLKIDGSIYMSVQSSICTSKNIIIDAGALKEIRGNIKSAASIKCDINDSINLKGEASIEAATYLIINAKNIFTNQKTKLFCQESSQIIAQDTIIIEGEATWSVNENYYIKANIIKNYSKNISANRASIHIDDVIYNYDFGKITTKKSLEFSGGSVWTSGEIEFGELLVAKLNKIFMHGFTELQDVRRYSLEESEANESKSDGKDIKQFFINKYKTKGSRIQGKNLSIVCGACISIGTLLSVENYTLCALAEFKFGACCADKNNKSRLISLDIGPNLPSVEKIIQLIKHVEKDEYSEAFKLIISNDIVFKTTSALLWLLETFIPKLGKPVRLAWTILIILMNVPDLIMQIYNLCKQKEKIEPHQLYSLIAIAGNIVNQALLIESQILSLTHGLGDAEIKNLDQIGMNLAMNGLSVFLPSINSQSLIDVKLLSGNITGTLQNDSILSLSAGVFNGAVNTTDQFIVCQKVGDFDLGFNHANVGELLYHSGKNYIYNETDQVSYLNDDSTHVTNRYTAQGQNLTYSNKSNFHAKTIIKSADSKLIDKGKNLGDTLVEQGKNVVILDSQNQTKTSFVSGGNVVITENSKTTGDKMFVTGENIRDSSDKVLDTLVEEAKENLDMGGNIESNTVVGKANTINLSANVTTKDKEATESIVSMEATENFTQDASSHIETGTLIFQAKNGRASVSGDDKVNKAWISGESVDLNCHIEINERKFYDIQTENNDDQPSTPEIVPDVLIQADKDITTSEDNKIDGSSNTVVYEAKGNITDRGTNRVDTLFQKADNHLYNQAENECNRTYLAGKNVDLVGNVVVLDQEKNPQSILAVNATETFKQGENSETHVNTFSSTANDQVILGKNNDEHIYFSSENTIQVGGTLEIQSGIIDGKEVTLNSDINITASASKSASQKLNPFDHEDIIEPDLFIKGVNSINTTEKNQINAKDSTVVLASEGTIDDRGKTHANAYYEEAKIVNDYGTITTNKGSIVAGSINLYGDLNIEAITDRDKPDSILHPAKSIKNPNDVPRKEEDAERENKELQPDFVINGTFNEKKGALIDAHDASIAFVGSSQDFEGTNDVKDIYAHSDQVQIINGDNKFEHGYFEADTTNVGGHIHFSYSLVFEDINEFGMTKNATIDSEKGTAAIEAKKGQLSHINTKDLYLKFDHIDQIEDLLLQRGQYNDIKASNNLSVATKDKIKLTQNIDVTYGIALTADSLNLLNNMHSNGNLIFSSTNGDIKTSGNLLADGIVFIDSQGAYYNQKGKVAGYEVYIHTNGDAVNNAGTWWGGNYLEVMSGGNIINRCVEKDIPGKHGSTMKEYYSGLIKGGDGNNHDGIGANLYAEGKVINDASIIFSTGSNQIIGVKGVESLARINQYISYYKKYKNWFKESETIEYTDQVQPSVICSLNGSNTIISTEGNIHTCSTEFTAKLGTNLYAKLNIVLTGYLAEKRCVKEKSAVFGLLYDNTDQRDQYAVPTIIQDMTGINIVSLSDVKIEVAAISTPGNLSIKGENILISAPILNHSFKEDSVTFNLQLPDLSCVSGYGLYEDLKALGSAQEDLQKLASIFNAGIDGVNTLNNILTALRTGSVTPVINPQIQVGLTHTATEYNYQTVADNVGIQCGSATVQADNKIEMINGVPFYVAGDASIQAKSLSNIGAVLKSSMRQESEGFMVGVDISGNFSASASYSEQNMQQTTYANQNFVVGGVLTTDVSDWLIQNANVTAGSWQGHVDNLSIISSTNKSICEGFGISVSTTGGVSYNQYSNNAEWIGVPSGIYIVNDINKDGGPQIIVNTTYLEGGKILSGGINHYKTDTLITKEVNEFNKGSSFGISGNLNDVISSIPSGQALPVWCVNIGKDDFKAHQLATIYGAAGTELDAKTVNGAVNTSNTDGRVVEYDKHMNIQIKIPIVNQSSWANFQNNLDWLMGKMQPNEMQYGKEPIKHHKKPKEETDEKKKENGLTEAEKKNIEEAEKAIEAADEITKIRPGIAGLGVDESDVDISRPLPDATLDLSRENILNGLENAREMAALKESVEEAVNMPLPNPTLSPFNPSPYSHQDDVFNNHESNVSVNEDGTFTNPLPTGAFGTREIMDQLAQDNSRFSTTAGLETTESTASLVNFAKALAYEIAHPSPVEIKDSDPWYVKGINYIYNESATTNLVLTGVAYEIAHPSPVEIKDSDPWYVKGINYIYNESAESNLSLIYDINNGKYLDAAVVVATPFVEAIIADTAVELAAPYVSPFFKGVVSSLAGPYVGEYALGVVDYYATGLSKNVATFFNRGILSEERGGDRVLSAQEIALNIAKTHEATINELKNGYKVTIPHGNDDIVIRLMEEGGGRESYYRVSIPGKQTFTVTGEVSTNPALTHIDIEHTTVNDLNKLIERIKNDYGKNFTKK